MSSKNSNKFTGKIIKAQGILREKTCNLVIWEVQRCEIFDHNIFQYTTFYLHSFFSVSKRAQQATQGMTNVHQDTDFFIAYHNSGPKTHEMTPSYAHFKKLITRLKIDPKKS